MASAMTPAEQQAITARQRELVDTRTKVQQLIDGHEALKKAHDALNIAAQKPWPTRT